MPRHITKLTRLGVIGLSAGALLPAAATAMPINDGQASAASGGPAVTASNLTATAPTKPQDVLRSPHRRVPPV